MKCILLAAGYATRLYPLTENFPKPLLKVGEKTILDWLMDDVKELVDEFIVISNLGNSSLFARILPNICGGFDFPSVHY